MHRTLFALAFLVALPNLALAEDPVFSGPQPGEKLAGFKVRGVFDDQAGQESDLVAAAKGAPILLVFVHKATRPSIGVTRVLMNYAKTRGRDGLHYGIVWLAEDATAAEAFLKRARHALPEVPLGISVDGQEGPGSYGLNRNVTLTILVAKENKVTANFALVQPSLQADAPQVAEAIVAVVGGKAPSVEELTAGQGRRPPRAAMEANLRRLIGPVLNKDATEAEVDAAAKRVEDYIAKHPQTGKEFGSRARRIVDSGKLANYGTERAQEYLRKWARKYGPAAEKNEPPKRRPPAGDQPNSRP